MRDPATPVSAYFGRKQMQKTADTRQLPPSLRLSVEERVRAYSEGALSATQWREENEGWAAWADSRYRACAYRKPFALHEGVIRLGVKDTIDVVGLPTQLGLRFYRHYPVESCVALKTINTSAVSIVAKLATTEVNLGTSSGCINPYVPHIHPGGSSTGAGVAVAANICDIALGTDVLGSVRWPAGFCGTVGLRMTHTNELLDGVFPLSPSMDALGWVVRNTRDLSFLWGHLGLDRLISASPVNREGFRIGLIENVYDGNCSSEMLDALVRAVECLRESRMDIINVRLDRLWQSRSAAWDLCARQAWEGYREWRDWTMVEPESATLASLELGSRVTNERYNIILNDLVSVRETVGSDFERHRVDAWLLPLHPVPPRDLRAALPSKSTIPSSSDPDFDTRIGYTPLASFAGLPAITLPVARASENGAPLCVQFIGPRHSERRLINIAERVEREVGNLRWALS